MVMEAGRDFSAGCTPRLTKPFRALNFVLHAHKEQVGPKSKKGQNLVCSHPDWRRLVESASPCTDYFDPSGSLRLKRGKITTRNVERTDYLRVTRLHRGNKMPAMGRTISGTGRHSNVKRQR